MPRTRKAITERQARDRRMFSTLALPSSLVKRPVLGVAGAGSLSSLSSSSRLKSMSNSLM